MRKIICIPINWKSLKQYISNLMKLYPDEYIYKIENLRDSKYIVQIIDPRYPNKFETLMYVWTPEKRITNEMQNAILLLYGHEYKSLCIENKIE